MKKEKVFYYTKKAVFIVFLIYAFCGFLFCFIECFYNFSFMNKLLEALDIYDYFFYESIIISYAVLLPGIIIFPIITWIFYRKETTVLGRIMITLMPVWDILSLLLIACVLNKISPTGRVIYLLPAAVFVIIGVFLIKEIVKYPKFAKSPDSAGAA